ncbi:unconventional myosin-Vc isoform X2 [Corythoichthys intestinalis]|uniref:unconventional myosin-Vc isoform X2 n=1 Tax=Corythoichthys intestinalis TaxID=161448 RepID=UPI0025A539EF|nr:unconventional myosin-Vc isoform X2 [Corythoichthys intestinalis]XP_061813286.1 unconventional myosin-Vc-like [Nerophis lumbriciformis]
MALFQLYTRYNRVWIPDAEHVWKSAEIVRDFHFGDHILHLLLEDGTELKYPVDSSPPELPPLRNPDILVGENDLTALSYLHEPAVLHNLKLRFLESRIIYTYCGIILVALNPYKQLHVYGDAIIHAYSGQNMGDMDPHIFAVAEEAYKQMARDHKNQSIIISGESGAGKTVSARYAMRYFAVVSKSGSKTQIEDKVLASNPITEAIGNAKTIRNDNSSRFGKFTEISFDNRYRIIGANMRTYLLEKSRVVFQAESERNYHIFYQICACAHLPQFKELKLRSADEFHYTGMGGNIIIEGVDDRKGMEETQQTFSLLGLKEDFQSDVFKVLAAILHLGNVEIKSSGDDRSSISNGDSHLKIFCELLGVRADNLMQWLCNRRLVLASETVVKPLPKDRAVTSRDALAKRIYAHLFDCIINRINKALQVPGKQHAFIGVLDIYGFETFDINSFEQFCINYANEKLQQQFNLHVFKLEQEEYMKEDIPWTLIDFYDNQPVIDLIEAKMGILDLLDEECLFPQGSDQSWLQKLYNYLDSNPLFERPKLSNEMFVIQHFADKVEYQCKGFLEKNRDALYEELIEVLRVSKFAFLAKFFQEEGQSGLNIKGIRVMPARPSVMSANKQLRTSVGKKFHSSLALLMDTLNATTPHYVRCIKPNDEKLPFEYDSGRVVQQLRACGVLETIRISAQSYPSRWTYFEFYNRYSVLMTNVEAGINDKTQTCKSLLQRLIQDSNQYKFGRTKIFLRAGQVAYLEKLRLDQLRGACITIQKYVRGWIQRRKYLRLRRAAILIQHYIRGKRTVRKAVSATNLKQGWSAVVIQRYWRGFRIMKAYQTVRLAIITIQAFTRGWLARKSYAKLVEARKALVLQKYARAWLARRRFNAIRRLVHQVQLSFRVEQLRKKNEEQSKENRGLVERLTSLASSHSQAMEKLQAMEIQLGKSANQKASLAAREKKAQQDASLKMTALQSEVDGLIIEKQARETMFEASTKEQKEKFDQIKINLLEEKETQARLRKMAENNLEMQRRDHEKELGVLREEIRKLKDERAALQMKMEDGDQMTIDLQDQVAQLTKHVKVIPELRKDIANLQSQKNNSDRKMKQQSEEARAKLREISRLLAGSIVEEDVLSGLTEDYSEKAYEAEDLLAAFSGLEKVTRTLENHRKEQKESYDSQIEGLKLKVDYLQNEYSSLQTLFTEKNNINENIRQEVSRLSRENSVIPELKVQISELLKQKNEHEILIENLRKELEEKADEMKNTFEKRIEEESSKRRHLEEQAEVLDEVKLDLQGQIKDLEEEKDLLSRQLQMERDAKIRLRLEATQLSSKNLDLQEQLDDNERIIKQLQNQMISLETAQKAQKMMSPLPKHYLGMLEYNREDESRLIKNLILDLKPKGVAVNMIPVLPAYILFMCVRHVDYLSDEDKLRSLMNGIITAVKKITTNHPNDLALLSFWLSNMYQLLNCLKQYSGEEEFRKQSTARQVNNCLQNFDLSDHQQVVSDLAICIYHQFIAAMERSLTPAIVPGMLEHESLQGISSMKPRGFIKRSSDDNEDMETYTISFITQRLSHFYNNMMQHGTETHLIKQVVKQLLFHIGATTLNNLLLRKDMCSCRKGMQIRCNISYLEEWLQEKELQNCHLIDTLKPLAEAAWLLQVSKSTDDDAKAITKKCIELNTVQIVKILNSYTPIDGFEKRVASSFVRKVQSLRQDHDGSAQLMIDPHYRFPVTFPFYASSQALELLQIPNSLHLEFLTMI